MLGGHVGPWTFDPPRAASSAAGQRFGQRHGGRCWSRPAPARRRVVEAFAGELRFPTGSIAGARRSGNPYLGFLALADRIIVTSDSMSMLVEAVATGKPVIIFDLADPPVPGRVRRRSARSSFIWAARLDQGGSGATSMQSMQPRSRQGERNGWARACRRSNAAAAGRRAGGSGKVRALFGPRCRGAGLGRPLRPSLGRRSDQHLHGPRWIEVAGRQRLDVGQGLALVIESGCERRPAAADLFHPGKY